MSIFEMKISRVRVPVFWLFSIILVSCSGGEFDGGSTGSTAPGSVLRVAAGMPVSIGEELIVSSEYSNQVEDAISSCMRSNGFNYFSERNEGSERVKSLGFDLSTATFTKQFGFGISNGAILGMKTQIDESREYLGSLSPEEYEAYRLALDGEDSLKQPGAEVLKIGGCRREALESVDQPPWYIHLEWINVVSMQLSQRLSADPRIVEIEQQWIECMAELGYNRLISEEELSNSLNNEFIQLFQTLIPTQLFHDGEEFLNVLDEESRAAFEAFRSKEIELAVASHECSSEHDDTIASISKEIERSIISSHPLN